VSSIRRDYTLRKLIPLPNLPLWDQGAPPAAARAPRDHAPGSCDRIHDTARGPDGPCSVAARSHGSVPGRCTATADAEVGRVRGNEGGWPPSYATQRAPHVHIARSDLLIADSFRLCGHANLRLHLLLAHVSRAPPGPGTASEMRWGGGDLLTARRDGCQPEGRGARLDRIPCTPPLGLAGRTRAARRSPPGWHHARERQTRSTPGAVAGPSDIEEH
jgi:hypothetical protein